jgi:molybdopterin-containing oxidoreductase family iron-sulfur binding subunit
MARWAMVIDLQRCTGCQACVIACKFENSQPVGMLWRRVIAFKKGEYPNVKMDIIPRPCMMCENTPCIKVCPVGATHYVGDGTVQIDYDKCIGCKYCMNACPYGARQYNKKEEEQPYSNPDVRKIPHGVVAKCTFCAHRRAKYYDRYKTTDGFMTACAQVCPAGATIFGDADDPESQVSKLINSGRVMRLRADLGTRPRVYYLIS